MKVTKSGLKKAAGYGSVLVLIALYGASAPAFVAEVLATLSGVL